MLHSHEQIAPEHQAGTTRVLPHSPPARLVLTADQPSCGARTMPALQADAALQTARAEPGHAAVHWQLTVSFGMLLRRSAPVCLAVAKRRVYSSLMQDSLLSGSVCLPFVLGHRACKLIRFQCVLT